MKRLFLIILLCSFLLTSCTAKAGKPPNGFYYDFLGPETIIDELYFGWCNASEYIIYDDKPRTLEAYVNGQWIDQPYGDENEPGTRTVHEDIFSSSDNSYNGMYMTYSAYFSIDDYHLNGIEAVDGLFPQGKYRYSFYFYYEVKTKGEVKEIPFSYVFEFEVKR